MTNNSSGTGFSQKIFGETTYSFVGKGAPPKMCGETTYSDENFVGKDVSTNAETTYSDEKFVGKSVPTIFFKILT